MGRTLFARAEGGRCRQRPLAATLLSCATMCLGGYLCLGAMQGWQERLLLERLPLSVPPLYLIGTRLVGGIMLLVLAVGLWRLRQWGRRGLLVVAGVGAVGYWLERLVWGRSDYGKVAMPCVAVIWGISLGCVGIILWSHQVRGYFDH